MSRDELYEIGLKKKSGEIPLSWNQLNEKYNYPFSDGDSFKSYVNKRYRRSALEDIGTSHLGKEEYKKTVSIDANGVQTSEQLIEMADEQLKDISFIMRKHGYDPFLWEMISCRNNIWNVYSKKDGIQVLYSSKISVKPLVSFDWKSNIDKIFDNIENKVLSKHVEYEQYAKNDNLLVVPIADLHYNLLSELSSSGNEYNPIIAELLYYGTLHNIKNRVQGKEFEKVLFVVGNDFINADNLSGTTTKLTPQDNANMWFTAVSKATEMIIRGTDFLRTIAPVDVLYVPSNHDLHTMYGIMQTVKAYFRNEKDVTVDVEPTERKYYMFGETLLAFSHDMRTKDALGIISTEAKQYWSESKHIILMLAHLHQAMVYENQGCLEILRLPTISGRSRWSNTQGYVNTDRKNQAFIIDSNLGITDQMNIILN